ncbi:MAG: AIPR family protein [Bacteroidia bacterium]
MAKDFDTGLRARINSFAKKFGITATIDEKELFEKFSNYTIVSNVIEDDFSEINKVSTGTSKGIDGIAIIVNDQIITEENDLDKIGENESIKVTLCFIQATTISSFDLKKFQSFNDEVINFLLKKNEIEPFSDIIDKLFKEEGRFLDKMSETPKVEIYFSSGKTNHTISAQELECEKAKFENRMDFPFQFNLENISILQTKELNDKFNNIDGFLEILVKFNHEIQLQEKDKIKMSLLSVLSFEEFKKIIITKDKILREKLFVENVRSKVKGSDINEKILETLSSEKDRNYFLYLNNGITILCESIRRHEVKQNSYYLKHPRIINGCQTSHMLFEHYLKKPDDLKEIELTTKLIATEDKELKKQIIIATNNQNPIDKDLESLNDFHTQLEEYFVGNNSFDIFYERLRGQHSDIMPPYKVIDKETIAKIYISIFLNLPHEMKSNALSKIEKYKGKNQIYRSSTNEDLSDYYLSGVLYYLLNSFLANNKIQLKSKTMDMHLLLVCNLILNKSFTSSSDKLKYLENIIQAEDLFKQATQEIENRMYLFERRGFYSPPKTRKLIEEIKYVS